MIPRQRNVRSVYYFGDLHFQPETGLICKGEQQIQLRAKTAEVLLVLLEHPQQVVTKDQLLDRIWPDCHVGPGSLVQSIQELRRALGDDAKNPSYIKTFPRRGYQWMLAHQSQATQPEKQPPSSSPANKWKPPLPLLASFLGAVLLALLLGAWLTKDRATVVTIAAQNKNVPKSSIMVLPIMNTIEASDWDWLAPGLRDLIVEGLNNSQHLNTFSISETHQQLAKKKLTVNQVTSATALELLQTTQCVALLKAEIMASNKQSFVCNYQIFRLTQAPQSGNISFTNPIELSKQLLQTLNPNGPDSLNIARYSEVTGANADYLRGKNAMKNQSASLAKHYFKAALLQDPQFHTSKLALARVSYLMGKWQEARDLYLAVQQTAIAGQKTELEIEAIVGLSRIDWRAGELRQSDTKLWNAQKMAKTIGNNYLEALCFRNLSWHAMYRGDWRESERLEQKARELTANGTDVKSMADELYYLGSSDSPHQDFEKSLVLLKMALEYYQQSKLLYDEAFTHLAIARNRAAPPHEQHQHLKQAEILFQQLEYHIIIPEVWEAKAMAYAQEMQFGELNQYIQRAYRAYEKLGLKGDLANVQFLTAIGELLKATYGNQNERQAALNAAEALLGNCEPFYQREQIVSRVGSTGLLRGLIAIETQNLEKVPAFFQRALDTFDALDFPEGLGVSCVAMANYHIHKGEWTTALTWLKRAEETYPQRPGLWQPFAIHSHLQLGHVDQARQLAESNLSHAKAIARPQAEALLAICNQAKQGNLNKIPPAPRLLATYFLTY